MKRRITIRVPVEKRGLFGIKKTVYETRTVLVDEKTYRKLAREKERKKIESFVDFMQDMEDLDEFN